MGRRPKNTTIEVHEGVYLLKPASGIFQCYFRLGGKQFRQTTKTRDLAKAKSMALGWFLDAQMKRANGDEIDRVSFVKLKRSYLEHIRGQPKFDYHKATIERHLMPFFAKFDDISKIKRKDVLDYLNYRQSKGDEPPLPQTINRENPVLRGLMRHAVDREWMKTAPEVRNQSERHTYRRRRDFTIPEYRMLHRMARKRAREFDGMPLKARQHWQRQLLYDLILLFSNSGMRVDEAKAVIWRNLDFDDRSIRLEGGGKRNSSRRLYVRPTGMKALERICEAQVTLEQLSAA